MNYVTPEHYKALAPNETRPLRELCRLAEAPAKTCLCGRTAWRLPDLGLCFTCITGTADSSEDYELVPTLYCLVPNHDPLRARVTAHQVVHPLRPWSEYGFLRRAHPVDGERAYAWVVRDHHGTVFGGDTPESALADFALHGPEADCRDLRNG